MSDTFFAPAERSTTEELRIARLQIQNDRFLMTLLESLPTLIMVLNRERQVLAANTRVLDLIHADHLEQFLGMRPGELIGCVHCTEGPGGCGTSRHCQACGAVLAILESHVTEHQAVRECRFLSETEGALDLEVVATPVTVGDLPLTICAFRDISSEKRRDVLQRVFFHDVINTAGGIYGLATLLLDSSGVEPETEVEYKQMMLRMSQMLVEEIKHQRELLAAEKGELEVEPTVFQVSDFMQSMMELYANHPVAKDRKLLLGAISRDQIATDRVILSRIIGNMIKNALEAVPAGGVVTIFNESADHSISFAVHNPGVIPENIQLQIFQRSFSTKSVQGRGIGTYSIKLFGEKYLKGKVSFISSDPVGTIFRITLPKPEQGE